MENRTISLNLALSAPIRYGTGSHKNVTVSSSSLALGRARAHTVPDALHAHLDFIDSWPAKAITTLST